LPIENVLILHRNAYGSSEVESGYGSFAAKAVRKKRCMKMDSILHPWGRV
jgi:hypothetical protein